MGAFCEATFVPGPMLGTAVWGKNQTWSLSPNALASGPSLLPRIGFVAWSWSSSGTDRALVLFRALACGESFRLEADCASRQFIWPNSENNFFLECEFFQWDLYSYVAKVSTSLMSSYIPAAST